MGLENWIVSLDDDDVGIATQNSRLFLSQDELSSFRLEEGTQICIRPQHTESPSAYACQMAGVSCGEQQSAMNVNNQTLEL
jgi:hypothetical protein